jgi:hypothetical protein
MSKPITIRFNDDLAEALTQEAERRGVEFGEVVRMAALSYLREETTPKEDNQLLIEVLRTRALLARHILEQTDKEMLKRLVKESRLDVEAQLKEREKQA